MFVSEDIKYIGVNDRKVDLFEAVQGACGHGV